MGGLSKNRLKQIIYRRKFMFNLNRIRRENIKEALIVTTCVLFGFLTNANANVLSGNLQKGNYDVGFKSFHTFDYSRAYKGKQGRPIQIAVWYPTTAKAPKMSFAEYVELYLTEEDFMKPTEKMRLDNLATWTRELAGRADPQVNGNKILQAKTFAVKNAVTAKGTFPVIIYGAGSQGEAFENSVLCEFLASHGYFVLASPAVGVFNHQTTLDAVGLEAQARDMEFLIAQSKSFPEADLSKLGVMGWSWGGLSAMLLQMRNPNVDAVVSLDGAIAMHENKLKQTAFSNPDLIRAPIMFMSARNLTPRVKSFIEKVNYSNSFLLDFSEVAHNDFSSYNFIARNFNFSPTDLEKKKKRAYEIVCQYVLRFFDAQLKGDKTGKEFLEQDSADKDLLSITRKTSLPLPPSQEEFFAIVREKGFDQANKIYRKVKSLDANYQIFEAWEITVLADELFKAGRADDALKSAQLRIEAYPNDYLSYEWLANLYYKQKDWNNALRHYESAYRMALKEKETPELLQELEWYRKRIETVKKNLSEKTTEVRTN